MKRPYRMVARAFGGPEVIERARTIGLNGRSADYHAQLHAIDL